MCKIKLKGKLKRPMLRHVFTAKTFWIASKASLVH